MVLPSSHESKNFSHQQHALACRIAGLAFLNGVTVGWTKQDLAVWLAGPYRAVTRAAIVKPRRDTPQLSKSDIAGLDPNASTPDRSAGLARLDDVIREARWRVLAELESAAISRGRVAFATRARSLGHVRWIDDGEEARDVVALARDGAGAPSQPGWYAVDVPGMRLRDRVLSLFAVDCLTHPLDYERALVVCHRCEKVTFDAAARGRGECSEHRGAH